MIRSKELEKKLGLERILNPLSPESYQCSHCQESKSHLQYEVSWMRNFYSKVDFRQRYQIRVCSSCLLTSFVENTWCEELDEFDFQEDVDGEVENNFNRVPDSQKISSSNYNLEQAMLLKELRNVFSPSEVLFVEEVLVSINSGLYDLSAIGVRSIIENFCHRVGTTSSREKFVSSKAKDSDGTTKTKNNYKYKILWLIENGLISSDQGKNLRSVISLGNFAAHRMDMKANQNNYVAKKQLLNSAIKTILALTITFQQLKFN